LRNFLIALERKSVEINQKIVDSNRLDGPRPKHAKPSEGEPGKKRSWEKKHERFFRFPELLRESLTDA
jgi:hypothetical protein